MAVLLSLVSWMNMIEALCVSASMSLIMCFCRLNPISSTTSAEREVTLYVAMGREGIIEASGLMALRLGG